MDVGNGQRKTPVEIFSGGFFWSIFSQQLTGSGANFTGSGANFTGSDAKAQRSPAKRCEIVTPVTQIDK